MDGVPVAHSGHQSARKLPKHVEYAEHHEKNVSLGIMYTQYELVTSQNMNIHLVRLYFGLTLY